MNLCCNFYKVGFATQLFQEFNKLKGDDTALTGLSPGVFLPANCSVSNYHPVQTYCKRFYNKTLNHTKCHELITNPRFRFAFITLQIRYCNFSTNTLYQNF